MEHRHLDHMEGDIRRRLRDSQRAASALMQSWHRETAAGMVLEQELEDLLLARRQGGGLPAPPLGK